MHRNLNVSYLGIRTHPSYPIDQLEQNATLQHQIRVDLPNYLWYPYLSVCWVHVHVVPGRDVYDGKRHVLIHPIVSFVQIPRRTISIAALIDHKSSIGVAGAGSLLSGIAEDEARGGSR